MFIRRTRRALVSIVTAAALVLGTAGTVQASSSTMIPAGYRAWSVPERKLYSYSYPTLALGACFAGSYAAYIEEFRTITVVGEARSTSLRGTCNARVLFTVLVFDWSEERLVTRPRSVDIPSTNWTSSVTVEVELGDEEELIDLINYDVVRR